jgi:hypothetical protein
LPAIHVEGKVIRDAEGRLITLHGFNIETYLEAYRDATYKY